MREHNLAKFMKDSGIEFTSNADFAIFMLPSGRMVDAMKLTRNGKLKRLDYRMFDKFIGYDTAVHAGRLKQFLTKYRVVRLVPEDKTILTYKNQTITEPQHKVIDAIDYKIKNVD